MIIYCGKCITSRKRGDPKDTSISCNYTGCFLFFVAIILSFTKAEERQRGFSCPCETPSLTWVTIEVIGFNGVWLCPFVIGLNGSRCTYILKTEGSMFRKKLPFIIFLSKFENSKKKWNKYTTKTCETNLPKGIRQKEDR